MTDKIDSFDVKMEEMNNKIKELENLFNSLLEKCSNLESILDSHFYETNHELYQIREKLDTIDDRTR